MWGTRARLHEGRHDKPTLPTAIDVPTIVFSMSDRAWNEIEGQVEGRVWSCSDIIAIISDDKIPIA